MAVGAIIAIEAVLAIVLIWALSFFRDPERVVPQEQGYISPADGKVLFTEHEPEEQFLGGRKVMKVSIFMSPANVHVNRVPCDGEVVDVKHKPGSFMAAYSLQLVALKQHHFCCLYELSLCESVGNAHQTAM